MTQERLSKECRDIMTVAIARIEKLKKEYALEHAKYQVGDIIKDHYHIIKVEKLVPTIGIEGKYTIKYVGEQLTTKLVPHKKQSDTAMYENNVEEKLN